MGIVVANARDSIESPVLAPIVARIFPLVKLTSFISPSVPPVATTVLAGLMAREVNEPASNLASSEGSFQATAPGWGVQLIRLPASEQVAMCLPEGEKVPAVQADVCPEKICITWPEGIFHIHTVPLS